MTFFPLEQIISWDFVYLSLIALHVFFVATLVIFTIKLWQVLGYFFTSLMSGDVFAKIVLFLCIGAALVIGVIVYVWDKWAI